MPKPPSEMTAVEIRLRLAELKVDEENYLCQVQTVRLEKAALELAVLNLEHKGK